MSWFWQIILVLVGLLCSEYCVKFAIDGRHHESFKKMASFLGILSLALRIKEPSYKNRRAALYRTFISFFALFGFLMAIVAMLNSDLPLRAYSWPVFVLAPLYHLTFALLEANQAVVNQAIQAFRLRAVLALIFGANCWFWHYFALGVSGYLSQCLLSFGALAYFFFLLVSERVPATPYRAFEQSDNSHGPVFIFHYWAVSLETLFYLIFFGQTFFKRYLDGVELSLHTVLSLGFVVICYLLLSVVVRLFFFQSSPLRINALEQRILPLSFWLLGASYLAERLLF